MPARWNEQYLLYVFTFVRSEATSDTFYLLSCMLLFIVALFLPESWQLVYTVANVHL